MNKKRLLILVLFTVLCILPLFDAACAEEIDSEKERIFVFPSSIEIIEDEAFEGTAVETVVFPEGLISIGSRAFENVLDIKDIYIPDTTAYIADSAFSITSKLTIHGITGSYAKDWANSHEIPFVPDNVWNAIVPSGRKSNTRTYSIKKVVAAFVLIILLKYFRLSYYELRSRRPQDRPELNPIDYCFP